TQCARQIDKQHACVALVEIRIENKSAVGNRNQPARTDLQVYGKGLTAGREPYPPVGISLVEMGQAGNWNRPRRGREVALDRTRVTAGRNGLLDIESLPLAVEAAHHHGSSPARIHFIRSLVSALVTVTSSGELRKSGAMNHKTRLCGTRLGRAYERVAGMLSSRSRS